MPSGEINRHVAGCEALTVASAAASADALAAAAAAETAAAVTSAACAAAAAAAAEAMNCDACSELPTAGVGPVTAACVSVIMRSGEPEAAACSERPPPPPVLGIATNDGNTERSTAAVCTSPQRAAASASTETAWDGAAARLREPSLEKPRRETRPLRALS